MFLAIILVIQGVAIALVAISCIRNDSAIRKIRNMQKMLKMRIELHNKLKGEN